MPAHLWGGKGSSLKGPDPMRLRRSVTLHPWGFLLKDWNPLEATFRSNVSPKNAGKDHGTFSFVGNIFTTQKP